MCYLGEVEPNGHPGRPRSQDVDSAILRAAVELLSSRGPDGLTINAVARRSRVARASIYLRYPGRDALLAATLRAAIGREPFPLSGDLERDLRATADQVQAILATPGFRAVLPEVVRGLLRQVDVGNGITYDMVSPNRRPIADEYARQAADAGLRNDVDPDLVGCMVVGSLLMLLLVDGVPPTPSQAQQTVSIILDGLSAKAVERSHRDRVAKRPSRPA
jgi:AcrR family transcriptional regulator